MLKFMFILCVHAAMLLAICSAIAVEPKRKDLDLKNHKPIAAAIVKFDEATLFEGVPRKKDSKAPEPTQKTIKIHEYTFFDETLEISADDAKAVVKLLANADSVSEQHPKFCGGFHPDYCLQLNVGKEKWLALVCLTCHEVKFYGPKKLHLYCDLKDPAYEDVKKILIEYRKNRPVPRLKPETTKKEEK
ncbi:MAG: hypothetical protein ACKVP0_00050 [Pirellulaceae bacterium]